MPPFLREGGFLHRLLCGFSNGLWYVDGHGRTVFANDALAAMLGCTPQEMRNTSLEDFLYPEDRQAVMRAIQRGAVVRGGSRPLALRRGGGEGRWFRTEVVPTSDLPGGAPGALVLLSETTAQRHNEEASAHFSNLVDTSDDAIYRVDLGNVITSWNAGAERMFGYTEDEALGRSADMLDPTEMPGQSEDLRELVAQGLPMEGLSVVGQRKDGRRLQIALSGMPVFDANDRVVGYSKVARDVTAKRRAAETQARLAAIVEASDDAIISKDLKGVIQTWNSGAERVFGYSAAEAIGRSIRMLIPEDRQHEETEILAALGRGERIDHFLTVRRRKDGEFIDVFVTASPIRDLDGRVVGIAKIARDVTEQMAARRERERRNTELEALLDERRLAS